jgi:nucleotide-binding universal stress UspA family protein
MSTRPALKYGVWLADLLKLPVHLLGINEHHSRARRLEKLCDEAILDLESRGIPYQVSFDQGRASLVIAGYAQKDRYLTVVGPLGRPIWRRYLQGRSFRRLMAHIETPIVYVPEACIPIKLILLCIGGLAYSRSVARLALLLAKVNQARITLMHIVEPLTLDYPVAQKVHERWQDVVHTDTPQGRNLRAVLADCEKADVLYDLKICQGNAVQEIHRELRQGDYDLVGMGSMYSSQGLRHLYMPNVTAEVAETAGRPVITVRAGYDMLGEEDDFF